MVKSVVNICGNNCGEIEKLSEWNTNWCAKIQKKKKKKKKKMSRRILETRGPAGPAVLVVYN